MPLTLKGVGAAASGLSDFLFGGSKDAEQTGTTRLRTEFRPEDIAALQRSQQLFGQRVGGLENLADILAGQAQQPVAALPGITVPQPATELDPLSQQLVSQGIGVGKQQAARTAADLQRQIGGPLAQILGAQAGSQAQLAANILPLQAMQQQAQRQRALQQLQLAAEQAQVQRALGQEGLEAGRRAEAFGFKQAALQPRLQQAGLLQQLAQMLGTRVQEQESKTDESGGLLGFLGL